MRDVYIASCLRKLSLFRIKELKDVLSQLGLSKQGRKQDLVERIRAVLSDEPVCKTSARKHTLRKEEIVRLIEDIYRKMLGMSATDLATTGDCVSANDSEQNRLELAADHLESELKMRCLCESSSATESMIKCDDRKCGIWQHLRCAIIPDEPSTGVPDTPEKFYCETCRLSRADPFLLTLSHTLNPVKLVVKNISVDGSNPLLRLEKSFHLTSADKDLLSKQEYDLQAWCMLVNDNVIYRMQWPQHAALHVNGMPVRATNRPGTQILGSNGRDDGPIITPCIRDGLNKISLEASDARTFCFGVRLVKRRSLQQIRNMVPKESDGEPIEEALARVRRCIGGASSAESESDNELVVIAESHVINLRCPMSGCRIKVAGRFRPCVHLGGFDLDIFLEINQRSRKWQCPICLKNYSLENIIIDPYFNRITTMMQNCSDDITDVEIKHDGCWRVKTKNESESKSVGDLACWHFSNGSLCNLTRDDRESREMLCWEKQEILSVVATRQNHQVNIDVYDLNLNEDSNPMSSTCGNVRDDKDCNGTTDYINSGIEYDSGISLNTDPAEKNRSSGVEVIELSDSDDDDLMIVTGTVLDSCTSTSPVNFNMPNSDIPTSYSGDHLSKATKGYDTNNIVSEVPDCGVSFGSWDGCSTGLYNSSSAVSASGANIHIQHTCVNSPSFTNGDTAPATSDVIALISDNENSFSETDQTHLPMTPATVSVDNEVRDQLNTNHFVDWNSRRLGDCQSDNRKTATASKDLDSRNHILPEQSDVDPTDDDAATLLRGLNDGGSNKICRPRPDFLFSCPRQNRSVRRRTYLSNGTD